MSVRDERLDVRTEDAIEEVEALVRQDGVLQKVPPIGESFASGTGR